MLQAFGQEFAGRENRKSMLMILPDGRKQKFQILQN